MRKNILKILIICMSVTFALGIFTACDNNGENLQDDNHNHNYTATVTEPTCTEQGYTTYTCECGESYKDNYKGALGHNYVWTTTKQPTETTKGTETGVCSRCQDTITRDIPKLNHEHSYTETIVAPTCTSKGYTLHKCSCGAEYRTDETEKTPHISATAVEENRIEAKCEENGGYDSVIYCAVCGTELSREHKILNATEHDYGDWIETVAPTCTTKGVETRYCSHDHSHTETRDIGELGHNYSVPTYTWSADNKTCTAERICLRDSNHRETETVNTTADIIQNQSCETDELTTYTAVFTNSAFATQTRANIKTKDKLGHEFTNYVSDNNATYDADGTKTAYCNHGCGAKDTVADIGTKLKSGIAFKTLSVDGNNVSGKVANNVTTYSFLNEITTTGNVTYSVSYDINGNNTIPSKTSNINEGDNVFYVLEKVNGEVTNLFTVNVRRREIYNVTFNTNGGTAVAPQKIEEDSLASYPEETTTRAGYTFTEWDYDFGNPITSNTVITASWAANLDTKYKAEYYLQNLADNNYTLTETVTLTGTTGTQATAGIKNYEHFTHTVISNSKESADINGDESTVLKVYYTRDKYLVKIQPKDSKITIAKSYNSSYKYGYQINGTSLSSLYPGYDFTGWYNGEELITSDNDFLPFIVDRDLNIIAAYAVKQEMLNFDFSSTLTTCTLSDVIDKTVAEIIIPNYITSINSNAFNGCDNLTSITVSDGNTNYSSVSGILYNKQKMQFVHIPIGIVGDIEIPNGITSIQNNAFAGRNNITGITIPNSVTSIGEYAFYNCSSLTSITIPDRVKSLPSGLFYGCSALQEITIPFVGGSKKTAKETYQYPFGYIFGTSEFTDSQATTQYYYGSSTSSTTNTTYYIPLSLKTVTVTGGDVLYGAFYNCDNLTNVLLIGSVASVGSDVFNGCAQLENLYIGDSVISIQFGTLKDCSSLKSITIPFVGETKDGTGTTHFGYIFGARDSYNNSSYVPSSLKTVVVTGGNSIGGSAFSGCSSLTSVTIGNGVTSIGGASFYNCRSLTSVTIPDSVMIIGDYAFSGCGILTSVYYTGTLDDWVSKIDRLDNLMYYISSNKQLYIDNQLVMEANITTATKINAYSFYSCRSLTSITIPDSVTSIGGASFYNCRSLTSVTIPDSVTSIEWDAFYGCSSLTSMVIGNSVTSIGSYAFYNCSGLTSITIPDSVTSIGRDAFYGCSSLTSVIFPDSVESIGYEAFYGCGSLTIVTITGNITSIGGYAFYNCSSLTKITIPDSVMSIGSYAFYGCSSLTSVTIPDGVTSIGNYVFYGCSSLTGITIHDRVTNIGSCAFEYCSGLTSVTIGNGVTSIGDVAFDYCSKLTSIYYTGTASQWVSIDGLPNLMRYGPSNKTLYINNEPVKNIVLEGITKIKSYAFYGCSSLTSITIGNGVTCIEGSAFEYCSSLTSVTIPDSVTSIEIFAFYGCSSLTSVIIGNGVTNIGNSAFYNCSSLTSVTIPDGVTSIGKRAFGGCVGLTSMNVSENNANYKSIDGDLYSKDGDTLIQHAIGKTDTEFTVPSGVTSIGSFAFYYCSGLTSVTIPDSVTSIGGSAFEYCSSLTSIYYTGTPSQWAQIDGLNYLMSSGRTLYINNGVVTEVVLDNITEIKSCAFYNCSGLTSITIPDSVTSIGRDAFYGCSSLTGIDYSGTKSQWSAISKGGSWKYDVPTSCKVHCTDGVISI